MHPDCICSHPEWHPLRRARPRSVALVTRRAAADEAHDALNSLSLLGPLVPLRHPGGAEGGGGLLSGGGRLVGYEFCLRFDWQAGLVARIDATRRTPVDVRALTRRACAAPRPLAPHEPPIIVRTLGPDAQNVGVHLDPASATVAELRGPPPGGNRTSRLSAPPIHSPPSSPPIHR